MSNKTTKCLIIGSGPSGYTAAIYAARADMQPIMVSGMELGGQLTTTTEVDNFPGYPQGITGPEMMNDLKAQAERFDTEIIIDMVTEISFDTNNKHLAKTAGGIEIEADTVIISTGASAQYLGLESEKKYMGAGVSGCATCDGFFYKGKEVIVVGGGDTAAEEATYLAKLCSKVTLLVRRDEMRASKAMQHRVLNTENIEVKWNTELHEVVGNEAVTGAKVINNVTKDVEEIRVDGIFIAIGHKPNTGIFKGVIDMDDAGYIITQPDTSYTNVAGVFAAGDCQDKEYRQAVTAAGSGCKAALDAERWLSAKE